MLGSNKNEVFTIGEIGINHNGDIDIAKKLIMEAKQGVLNQSSFKKEPLNMFIVKKN